MTLYLLHCHLIRGGIQIMASYSQEVLCGDVKHSPFYLCFTFVMLVDCSYSFVLHYLATTV